MKNVLKILGILFLPVALTHAQSDETPVPSPQKVREMSRKNTERLTERLRLSEQQIVEVSNINDEMAERMIQLNQQRQNIMQEREEKLKKVLTEEQYQKLQSERSEKRKKAKELRSRR